MLTRSPWRSTTRLAAVAAVGIALTSCSSGGTTPAADGGKTAAANEKVTLTLATFNEFGYEDLVKEYMAAHPNVTIQMKKAATSNEARENMNTRLAAGSGLSDIEAVEVDWLPELLQYPDKFVDLMSDSVKGRRTASSSATALTWAQRPSATAPTCSPPLACRPTAPRSPSCSAPPGTATSPPAASSRPSRRCRGPSPPARSTRPWSTR